MENYDKELVEVMDLVNTVQNKRNSFVNLTYDDICIIAKHIDKNDLNYEETVETLIELGYV